MSTNKILSLSIDAEFQEKVKKEAKRKGVSVSKLIRDIVEKNIPNDSNDGLVHDTIILRIPSEVKASVEKLREWLKPRFEGIVNNLTHWQFVLFSVSYSNRASFCRVKNVKW